MKKIFKRVSAAVIALVVTATAVVFDVPGKLIAAAAGHTAHAVCGDTDCSELHENITDWIGISDLSALETGKHYYLNADVELSDEVTIGSGVDITLCLNGHTITAAADKRIFSVNQGSLTLCDCDGNGKLTGGSPAGYSCGGGVYISYEGAFTMYGGTISGNASTGNNTSYGGGGVLLSSGTFIMNGGAISENTAKNFGGGVYVDNYYATFTMNGGTISGNTANQRGGGVFVENGTFIMNGGTISDNTVTGWRWGGGVYVGDNGKFSMNDGTISDNIGADRGGGVCVYGIGAVFTMVGGTISGNTATNYGGGVYFSEGTFTMSGGTITGNTAGDEGGGVRLFDTATLNGVVDITGNKKSDNTDNNLFPSTSYPLTIGDSFSSDSAIGISTRDAPTDCSTGTVAVTGEVSSDISGSFMPDVDGQVVVYKDKTVHLAVHTYSDEWSSDDTNHWHKCTSCDDITDEAEHTFVDKSDETNHWQECSACGYKKDVTEHSWGDWSLTTEPTLTTTGTAERECSFGETQTKTDVPALTDTTVWTKVDDKHIEPTEETDGKDVYTSTDYGEVTVILPSLEHTHKWGEWTITTEPTLTTTGTAERECSCGEKQTESDVPALTDTSVWTKDDTKHVEPTEETDGEDVYTSEYGEVTVVLPSLEHTHKWGEWAITIDPTLTTMGEAERECSCGETQIKTDVPALTDTSVWTKDDTKHVEPTEETDGRDVYTSEYGEVTVVLTSLGHTHEWGGWTITIEPTLTATGAAHRVCTENDTHIDTITLPALTDTSVWTKVDDKHVDPTDDTDGRDVYTSEYGEVTVVLDKSSHTHKFPLTYVPEVKPTEDKEGVKEHWHCDDCGKDFADENGTKEVTADDLRIGKIQTEVQAPVNVEIATPKEELITAALTEEEQQKITEGTDIKIILKVENAAENISAEDKGKVETEINGLSGYKLGQYLDITLLKKIGEEQEQKITKTNAPIKITFEIPEGLRGKAEYSVIRVHDGTATVLRDLDSDPNTVTIETDKFSTYALTYKEKTTTSNPSGGNSSGGNSGSSRPSGGNYGGSSDPSTSTPTENDNSDDTSSDVDIPSSDDDSDITSGESEPTEEDNFDVVSSDDGGVTSDDDGGTVSSDDDTSSGGFSSSDESIHAVSETGSSENNGNPSTGIALSLIPLVTAAAILTVAIKLKKK